MNDPIADLTIRLRNALASGKKEAVLPFSRMKESIAQILKKEGYLDDVVSEQGEKGKILKLRLGYTDLDKPKVREVKRVSKPGRRVYAGYRGLKPFKQGLGMMILSTPQGLRTDRQVRKEKLGGEVLIEIF